MKTEQFLSKTYIPDPEAVTRHRLVTKLCNFFGARDCVRWTPLLSAHLRVLVSELTGSNATARSHFERMYHLDMLMLNADNRCEACDLILETIGLDAMSAEQFLLKGGWTRVRSAIEDFCEDAEALAHP